MDVDILEDDEDAENKRDLTEEEYDALDEKWTKTTPKAGPNGTGFFAQRRAAMANQSIAAQIPYTLNLKNMTSL